MNSPSRQNISQLFDKIATKYDLNNRILSFGIDGFWRRRMLKALPDRRGLRVLDVATGTGDVALKLINNQHIDSVVGLDISEGMLKVAKEKIEAKNRQHDVTLVHGSVLEMPFLDESFDAVTISFGIRNVTDVEKSLKEMRRVLRAHGRVLILEFSLPPAKLVRKLHFFYLQKIVPIIGKLISGEKAPYEYLNQSIETFPYGIEFGKMVKDAGFDAVEIRPMTLGIATLYIARKF
ncbi:MAG: bifunctional demethylmenaquinone methyltransferase/2-methoxy-6-polyprenyl-1,4-benzoquinol methylase UbiE [Patescibacteria group bacterium]